MSKTPLTTGQIAEYCHVTYRAVLKWIEEGKLRAYRTPGKHSRVRVEDFVDFLKKYNMPVPAELRMISRVKRILIADDDTRIVDLISATLREQAGLTVKTALDGFSAGQQVCSFQPHLVILDINMPGLDGFEVCRRIRSNPHNEGVKILIVSGLVGTEREHARAIEAGADAVMSKPFDVSELKAKVGELLDTASGADHDENHA